MQPMVNLALRAARNAGHSAILASTTAGGAASAKAPSITAFGECDLA